MLCPSPVFQLQDNCIFSAASYFETLSAFVIELFILAEGALKIHFNMFLAAFAAGKTVANVRQGARKEFRELDAL